MQTTSTEHTAKNLSMKIIGLGVKKFLLMHVLRVFNGQRIQCFIAYSIWHRKLTPSMTGPMSVSTLVLIVAGICNFYLQNCTINS